jgi:hypothetical protein
MSKDLYDLSMLFKLTTGDSIICQVISDNDNNIIIRDPIQISKVSVSSEEGIRVSTYYSKWFQDTSSRIHMIRKQHILSAAIPDETSRDEYIRLVMKDNDKPISKKPTKKDHSWLDDLNFKFDGDQDRFKN